MYICICVILKKKYLFIKKKSLLIICLFVCFLFVLFFKMSDGESRCPLCAGERVADPFGDHQVGCGGEMDTRFTDTIV